MVDELESVVMPMRYLWVFLAYMMLNKAYKKFNSLNINLLKNQKSVLSLVLGLFAFTARFACILGMVPKPDYTDPKAWWFQLFTNIITPLS